MTELETATRALFKAINDAIIRVRDELRQIKPPGNVPLKIRKEICRDFYGKVKAEFVFPKKNRQYRKIARRNRKGII